MERSHAHAGYVCLIIPRDCHKANCCTSVFCFLRCCVVLYFLLQEDLGLPESTYELCYNAACALIGQGQFTEALNKLRQAEGQFYSVLPFYQNVYSHYIHSLYDTNWLFSFTELCRVSLADDSVSVTLFLL